MSKKLHLGSGFNYLDGWINIDINSNIKTDLLHDLRKPLPYPDYSIDLIFNEHFIEHISYDEAFIFLKECYRVLKLGGILRISTPNLDWLLEVYRQNKLDEYKDVGWIPSSRCRLMNEGMRSWGHEFLYNTTELYNILDKSFFSKIIEVPWRVSQYIELNNLENRPYHKEIIIEATK